QIDDVVILEKKSRDGDENHDGGVGHPAQEAVPPVEETEVGRSPDVKTGEGSVIAARLSHGSQDHPVDRTPGRRRRLWEELDGTRRGEVEVSEIGDRIRESKSRQKLSSFLRGAPDAVEKDRDVQERHEKTIDEAPELEPRRADLREKECRRVSGKESAIRAGEKAIGSPRNDLEDGGSERRVENHEDGNRRDSSRPGYPRR